MELIRSPTRKDVDKIIKAQTLYHIKHVISSFENVTLKNPAPIKLTSSSKAKNMLSSSNRIRIVLI
jgi:hypothetical protein